MVSNREVLKLSIFYFLLYSESVSNFNIENLTKNVFVNFPLGRMRGSLMKTRLEKDIFAFRGVRYAKPPVDERRFKPPEPIEPWIGEYDASREGPSCPRERGYRMRENCLTLNIYTTYQLSNAPLMPVIVFIHPGGFYDFSSQSLYFGPEYLLDQGVVLVTVNYRLGTLGFISTGDAYAPGNLGLKDQVLALRFVRDYIRYFGGDSNVVTLAGQSAGSKSVFLHLVSPMSKGLFHGAIAMSGCPVTPDFLPTEQTHLAIKQAAVLNCSTANLGEVFSCLLRKPAIEISKSLPKFYEWQDDPKAIWYAVVEPEISGVERFLPAQPLDLIRSGSFNQVPLIVGLTRDEDNHRIRKSIEQALAGNFSTFNDLNTRWEELAPISFLYERGTERSKMISRQLYEFYFHNETINPSNSDRRGQLISDALINLPTLGISYLIASMSEEPLFFYRFTYEGRYSFYKWSNNTNFGVSHCDDLMYLFYMRSMFPFFKNGDTEILTLERMTRIWANFARTGEPFAGNDPLFSNVAWDKFNQPNGKYLDIGKDLTMKDSLYAEQFQLWQNLFPAIKINS